MYCHVIQEAAKSHPFLLPLVLRSLNVAKTSDDPPVFFVLIFPQKNIVGQQGLNVNELPQKPMCFITMLCKPPQLSRQ